MTSTPACSSDRTRLWAPVIASGAVSVIPVPVSSAGLAVMAGARFPMVFPASRRGFTPEDVAAHRAADRAAGILHHHQPPQRLLAMGRLRIGMRGGQPERHAEREMAAIDRETAAGQQRHALGAERPVAVILRRRQLA